MQLSLLQSRLIASLAASLFILVLYLVLFSPNFALAAELDSAHVIRLDRPLERSEDGGLSYEPDFPPFDRSIVGRAPPGVTALGNNVPMTMNLQPGSTECFMVEQSTIASRDTEDGDDLDRDVLGEDENGLPELKRRADSSKTIYISVNTCLQPQKVSGSAPSIPPQLTLYVSNSSDITCPNAATNGSSHVQSKALKEGAAVYKIQMTGDVYIGVSAPNISTNFTGVYNFEIAASLEEYFHQIDESGLSQLLWMDSDSTSALLVSRDLTRDHSRAQQVMDAGPPYELFVENNESPSIDGLRHSICGLANNAQISANRAGNGKLNNLVRIGMTTRGQGGFPKQQFYFTGLNASSSYWGILYKARKASSNPKRQEDASRGGGTVFAATQFNTSSGRFILCNCAALLLMLVKERTAKWSPTWSSAMKPSTPCPETTTSLIILSLLRSTITMRRRCTATSRRCLRKSPVRYQLSRGIPWRATAKIAKRPISDGSVP